MADEARTQVRTTDAQNPWGDVGHDTGHQKVPVQVYGDDGYANNAVIVDNSTTVNMTYIGIAPIGSGKDEAVWRIIRLNETTHKEFEWADGNDSYDNVWDDRDSLSYSL